MAAVVFALAPGAASAFERASVEGDASKPLYWANRRIEMRGAYETCLDVSAGEVRAALLDAMNEWETAGGGCTDIAFAEGDHPTGLETNLYGSRNDGENRIVWHEETWPADADPDALAVTTWVYDTRTGEIKDADIDVNGVSFTWTTSSTTVLTDVQNTFTHELGHVLGFAHVVDPEATMYGSSDVGELAKRDLSPDDVAAVCTVYPFGDTTPVGLHSSEGGLLGVNTLCSVGRGGGARSQSCWTLMLGALVIGTVRRRRAARR